MCYNATEEVKIGSIEEVKLMRISVMDESVWADVSLEDVLEPSQLSDARRTPLGRRRLTPSMLIAMWALRLYVLVALPLVGYVFFRSL